MYVIQKTLALIYQPNVETSADMSAEIILRQASRVIHETFVSHQSERKNGRTLINAAAGNDRNLNTTPQYILGFEASPLQFTTWRDVIRLRSGTIQRWRLKP